MLSWLTLCLLGTPAGTSTVRHEVQQLHTRSLAQTSDSYGQEQQVVAVLLAIDDLQALAIHPESGKVIFAAELDAERCLTYTSTEPSANSNDTMSTPAPSPVPSSSNDSAVSPSAEGLTLRGDGVGLNSYSGKAADQPYKGVRSLLRSLLGLGVAVPVSEGTQNLDASRITFALRALNTTVRAAGVVDVSTCGNITQSIVSTTDVLNIKIKVNALVSFLPPGALSISNGEVLPSNDTSCNQPPCPYVDGPWSIFEVQVKLGRPNTLTNISIAYNAMEAGLIDAETLDTGASQTLIITRDNRGPTVS